MCCYCSVKAGVGKAGAGKAGVGKAGVVKAGVQVAEARKKRSTDDASIIRLPFDKVKRFSQVNQKL